MPEGTSEGMMSEGHPAGTHSSRGVLMLGGSIDYRVSAAGTWLWTPARVPHEESTASPGHQPGHTGVWAMLDDGGSGPNRTAGHAMADATSVWASSSSAVRAPRSAATTRAAL